MNLKIMAIVKMLAAKETRSSSSGRSGICDGHIEGKGGMGWMGGEDGVL